jgi:hypothetical protein
MAISGFLLLVKGCYVTGIDWPYGELTRLLSHNTENSRTCFVHSSALFIALTRPLPQLAGVYPSVSCTRVNHNSIVPSWLHTQISALAICTPYNPCTLRACASSHSKLHVLITPLPLAHFAPTQSTIIPDPPVTGRDDKAESTGRVPRLCARKTMYQTQAKRTAREA